MNQQPLYATADIVAIPNPRTENPIQIIVSDVSDVFDIPMDVAHQSINHKVMTDVMNNVVAHKSQTPIQSVSTKVSELVLPTLSSPPRAPVQLKSPVVVQQPQPQPQPLRQPQILRQPQQQPQSQSPPQRQSPPVLSIPNIKAHTETIKKTQHKHITNGKVIIEDEDKDTAIDYDDDDPEIKKTKLSLFHFAKDITFNLIFTIPFLRTKLNSILREPNLAINQIERVFDEFKDLLNKENLESIKKYVCEDGVRDKLNFILESGFNKILSDGRIDINDAPQFNQLVYFIIRSFNNINQGKVYHFYVSKEHVMLLLHFILKSVFTLTLKGEEEQMAIGLLDTSFKLVQLEVLPLISKRWYHKFRICRSVKEIEELIE
jgi:hypothetical protein